MINQKKIEWILRIGIAGEFLGHGILAVLLKADWIAWTQKLTGMDVSMATTFIFVVGLIDIALALIVLIRPVRPLLLWMAFWGFWTALVRPLVADPAFGGTSTLDFVERFANWAAPLALYYLYKLNK